MVFNFLRELNAACAKFDDGLDNVVAVEGDVGGSGRSVAAFCRMHAEISLRRIENQPATAYISSGETELVP
jgi:hypothetical protein